MVIQTDLRQLADDANNLHLLRREGMANYSCDYQFVMMCTGILEVLHCVLEESPEALNVIKEGHITSIISLLDKHGRNHKVRMYCM